MNDITNENRLLKEHISRTYMMFFVELLMTALAAFIMSKQPLLLSKVISIMYIGKGIPLILLIFAIFGLLSKAMHSNSIWTTSIILIVIIAVISIPLGMIPYIYDPFIVYEALFSTSIIYVTTAAYGLFTKKNYSSWGGPLFGSLLAMIVMMVISNFVHNSLLNIGILIVNILIFTIYIIYDNQMIKHQFLNELRINGENITTKSKWIMAISGSVNIYLDFINIFMSILQFLDNRND